MDSDIAQASAVAQASGALVVLSYLDGGGFPHMHVPAAVRSSDGKEVVLSVNATVLNAVKADSRVSLLLRAPQAATCYQATGRARPLNDQAPAESNGEGSLGATAAAPPAPSSLLVVDLDLVEVTERQAPQATLSPAREVAGGTFQAPLGPAVLQVAGLTIYYGSHRAVNDLSLEVAQGEIFGLLGPNGAGKTSTLSAIEGLLRPRSGRIMLGGTDVLRHPLAAKAKMGVQLQSTNFQSNLTIRQIVRLFSGLYGVRMTEADISKTIASAGLEAEAGKPFKQLSGGQQQRLALQIAVLHDPLLLLLDEPTSGLDPQARRQLWGRIEGLRQEGGSIFLTTHSMEEAQAVCDRVAIMDHGELLTVGPPLELIDRHRDDPRVLAVAHGDVTLDDVFVGLTGTEIRD